MKVANTPTQAPRNPRAALDTKNYRYVAVQKDAPAVGYSSPLEKMLDKPSPTRDGEMMYELAHDGADRESRAIAGGSDMVLLRTPIADHDAMLAANDAEARSFERQVDADEEIAGGAISLPT